MKGAAASRPGEVIVVDFPEPEAWAEDAIVEILACGICSTDVKLVQKGAEESKYALGHEMVGKILKAPQSGTWEVGQHVAVAPYLPCGKCYYCQHGQETLCTNLYAISPLPGGLAERILVPAELARRGMFAVPAGLKDELAALAEPLGCVVKGLEDAFLKPGDSLLVVGDGSMGQLAAAAGKACGAAPVIVAGMTDHRLQIAGKYFADVVVDVTKEDLREAVLKNTGQRGADIAIAAVSSAEVLASAIDAIRPGGVVNAFAGVPEGTQIPLDVRKVHYKQYYLTGSFGTTPTYMDKALDLLKASAVDYSKIVSAVFPFSKVGDAVAYVENRLGLKSVVVFP